MIMLPRLSLKLPGWVLSASELTVGANQTGPLEIRGQVRRVATPALLCRNALGDLSCVFMAKKIWHSNTINLWTNESKASIILDYPGLSGTNEDNTVLSEI